MSEDERSVLVRGADLAGLQAVSSHPQIGRGVELQSRWPVRLLAEFAVFFGVLGLLGFGWSMWGSLMRLWLGIAGVHGTAAFPNRHEDVRRRRVWVLVFAVGACMAAAIELALLAAQLGVPALLSQDPWSQIVDKAKEVARWYTLEALIVDAIYDAISMVWAFKLLWEMSTSEEQQPEDNASDLEMARRLASVERVGRRSSTFPGTGQRLGSA
mmetsp:Transcript_7402/g.15103  ORF Transcript_7402/g.15103 Transcript_7402/m.15103 type:complete len:213 (-) Transcript_7402:3142-3780(-)